MQSANLLSISLVNWRSKSSIEMSEAMGVSVLSSDAVELGGGFLSPRRGSFRAEGGMPKIANMLVDEVANAN